MTLLPSSIADQRFQLLAELLEVRLATIDLTRLLVRIPSLVPSEGLPALGWEFRSIDDLWSNATEEERRVLLGRVLERRRHGGTRFAVRDALSAIGFDPIHMQHRPAQTADGTLKADGTFLANFDGNRFVYWFAVVADTLSADERTRFFAAATNAPKQKSVLLEEIYYVAEADAYGDLAKHWSDSTVDLLANEDGEILTTEDGHPLAA